MSRRWLSRHFYQLINSCVVLACVTMATGCRPNNPAPNAVDETDILIIEEDIDVGALMPIETTPAPENLSEGVQQLVAMRDSIAAGFADNDVDSVHDELHSVGDLLENIEGLIKSSSLTADQKTNANAAIKKLFDAYGAVDESLHGDGGKEYDVVSGDIDSAVTTLKESTTETK